MFTLVDTTEWTAPGKGDEALTLAIYASYPQAYRLAMPKPLRLTNLRIKSGSKRPTLRDLERISEALESGV